MNPQSLSLYNALQTRGEPLTLRRQVKNGATLENTDVACKGRVDETADDDARASVGNVSQTVKCAIISNVEIENATWPGPPKINDKILIRGKDVAVIDVKSYKSGNEYCRHEIWFKGA